MSSVKKDENSISALVVQNTLGTSVLYPTGAAYGSVTALHVAVIDASGNQITTFPVSGSPTGAAVPANAFYVAGKNADGTLQGFLTHKGALNGYSPTDGSNILAVGLFAGNKDNGLQRIESISTDIDSVTPGNFPSLVTSSMPYIFNGTNWDRLRNANTAHNTSGTGLLGVGLLAGGGGGNWFDIGATNTSSDGITPGTGLAVGATGFSWNGSSWDRMRSANTAKGGSGTGLLGAGIMAFDGANWQSPSIYIPGDGNSNDLALEVMSRNQVWNGASWDRIRGNTTVGQFVSVKGGLMPDGTALNTYSVHLTTNTTTTPVASTAYVSSIVVSNEVGGTTSSVTIQDKQGTPLKLVNGLATTALTTAPTVINFQTPVKMVSGIDIITAGAVAATIDIWINYYN